MINEIRGLGGVLPQEINTDKKIDNKGPSFQDILKEKSQLPSEAPGLQNLNFSAHAVDRMSSRGIKLQPGDMQKLEAAVDKAQKKGSKDTLLLLGESAFIVNVKNRTVVTAMDRAMMKENVFTNIDSTIVL
jgi:flagellar operon protein